MAKFQTWYVSDSHLHLSQIVIMFSMITYIVATCFLWLYFSTITQTADELQEIISNMGSGPTNSYYGHVLCSWWLHTPSAPTTRQTTNLSLSFGRSSTFNWQTINLRSDLFTTCAKPVKLIARMTSYHWLVHFAAWQAPNGKCFSNFNHFFQPVSSFFESMRQEDKCTHSLLSANAQLIFAL